MEPSRRRILVLTSSLALPALTGCLGLSDESGEGDESSGGDSNDGDSGGGGGSGSGGGSDEETTEATPTETATPEPTREFLERTRSVMDEIRWFGTEYERARRRFVLEVKPVRETIARQRELNTLTESDVTELRSKTEALAAYVRDELAPHFELDRRLRNGENTFVREFASAVEQNDTAAQQEALSRLSVFYTRVTNEAYMNQNLSAHPIEDPLHTELQAGEDGTVIFGLSYPPGDNFTTQTFSDEYSDREEDETRPHVHTFPTGQRVFDHAHTFDAGHDIRDHENERPNGRIYTFSEGAVDILKDSKAWREELFDYEPEFTNVFDATVVREGRVDYAYVMANKLITDTDDEDQFGGQPIFVQRFEDAETAVSARETLLSTTLGEEGTTTLAGREWTKVFYDYDGPNLYANLLQVGEFLLATSVSSTPHRNRDEDEQWPEQLELSWLGMEVEGAADG